MPARFSSYAGGNMTEIQQWPKTYMVQLTSSLWVNLPLVRSTSEGFSFYSFNMIGKANWNKLIAHELLNRLAQKDCQPQVFITAEAKAIALTQELARDANHDRYIVLRKSKKSYMNNPSCFRGESITSGKQEYWIEEDDLEYLSGREIIVVDDVISTGKTAQTFMNVARHSNSRISCFCCALTEGTEWKELNGIPVISLAHIPLPGIIPA
jgi:adenine phosphoribosyltransferase